MTAFVPSIFTDTDPILQFHIPSTSYPLCFSHSTPNPSKQSSKLVLQNTSNASSSNPFFNFILKSIVKTKGVKNSGLEPCPFCSNSDTIPTGFMLCEACNGSGHDALGQCLVCDGNKSVLCTVCDGVGQVDIVRRGGTDTSGEFISSLKKQAKEKRGKEKKSESVFVCEKGSNGMSKKCECYSRIESQPMMDYQGEGPMEDTVQKGKVVSFCACGQSNMLPYCGGAHRDWNAKNGTNYQPYTLCFEQDTKVVICRCGHSSNRPYCDGSHNSLQQI